jgi:hypothetical protein
VGSRTKEISLWHMKWYPWDIYMPQGLLIDQYLRGRSWQILKINNVLDVNLLVCFGSWLVQRRVVVPA